MIASIGEGGTLRRIAFCLLVAGVFFGFATFAVARGADGGGRVEKAHVYTGVKITVPSTHALSVSLGSTTTTNLTLHVHSTLTWSVTVVKDHDLQSSGDSIPSSRLKFTSSTSGVGTGVSTDTEFPSGTPTNVITNGVATPLLGNDVTVSYKLTTNYDDTAGSYSASHTYTLTAL